VVDFQNPKLLVIFLVGSGQKVDFEILATVKATLLILPI
jgi:hypothetical protein